MPKFIVEFVHQMNSVVLVVLGFAPDIINATQISVVPLAVLPRVFLVVLVRYVIVRVVVQIEPMVIMIVGQDAKDAHPGAARIIMRPAQEQIRVATARQIAV